MERSKRIIRTCIIGIITNFILVAFKMTVGFISGSIAIILDAVNNLSDGLSSVITIIGIKLAGRSPDKKHPYGHGRVEYISTVVISILILFAGFTCLRESVDNIISGTKAHYSVSTLVIVICGVVIKIFLGRFVKRTGQELDAKSLIASGRESLFDASLAAATFIAAMISIFFGISLEGYLAAVIAVLIIKSGIEMLVETLAVIIGIRSERELTGELRNLINSFPEVKGTFDIILHNYGPAKHIGSAHIEVDESMDARSIHHLTQKIIATVNEKMDIVITIGVYSDVKSDPEAVAMRNRVAHLVGQYPDVLQMHGFYLDGKTVGFDLIIDFKADQIKIRNEIISRLREENPEYKFLVLLDMDYSD